jgi:hypothetical protein
MGVSIEGSGKDDEWVSREISLGDVGMDDRVPVNGTGALDDLTRRVPSP